MMCLSFEPSFLYICGKYMQKWQERRLSGVISNDAEGLATQSSSGILTEDAVVMVHAGQLRDAIQVCSTYESFVLGRKCTSICDTFKFCMHI